MSVTYVVAPPEIPTLPVVGLEGVFPIRRVFCVGRNYAAHAREMGSDPDREPPFFFMKPADAVVRSGAVVPYPPATRDLQHEIELVVAIGEGGHDIPAAAALRHVYGYAVGVDLTRRDLQGEAKKTGRPWEVGKAFEHSAPCSELVPASEIGHPAQGAIWLKVNGTVRQEGDLDQMIWKVPEMISYLSGLFELAPGDVILSGTPSGVSAVTRGDVLHDHVNGIGELHTKVV